MIKSILSSFINKDDTVLDIGCGIKEYSYIGKTTTVDAWDKLTPDYLLDVTKEPMPFKENSFDYILMIDFIEHLEKEDGIKLLESCKKIVKNKIFIFTPSYFVDNGVNVNDPNCWAYGNKYDYHKSLWLLDDFPDWTVIAHNDQYYFGYWTKHVE